MHGSAPALLPVRRTLAVLTLLLALLAHGHTPARAGDYPDRPVKIVVPFPAGGTADAVPRIVADWLSRKWSQPVVIENRTGASGNIGTGAVARAAPDGYTILFNTMSVHTMNHALFASMPFDGVKDFSPLTLLPT